MFKDAELIFNDVELMFSNVEYKFNNVEFKFNDVKLYIKSDWEKNEESKLKISYFPHLD